MAAHTKPSTEPIILEGEIDAYPGETLANAYARLHDYGCQCGWVTTCNVDDDGSGTVSVHVGRTYRLRFVQCGELTSVYVDGADGEKILWEKERANA